MTSSRQRASLRKLLAGDACVHPGSVADPISARIAESLGFEIGMFSGSVASMVILGAPDLTLITLSEFVEQTRRICRASSLPIMVDADHGYGNALSVMRTVVELENAGVAALTIEDTMLPAVYGESKTRLVSTDEAVDKLRAALQARSDPATVIVGRSQAVGLGSIEEAVDRVRAFQKTGVDAIFMGGVKTRAQLEALAAVATVPLLLGNVNDALSDRSYLAAHKVRIALQGHQPYMAAIQASFDTLKALRDGVAPSALERIAEKSLVDELTQTAKVADDAREYLKT